MNNISNQQKDNIKNYSQNIIDINNLFFSYDNKKLILNNINLQIKQGEFIAIIGPNGCGKSTLVKHLNGLLLPASGEVKSAGHLTTDKNHILEIRKNIAMVFQNPDNQIVSTIVEEDVAFALENLGVEPEEIRCRVDNALKIVDMFENKKRSTTRLSGGQKQRVAIACAIAMSPKCIVFDEATSMLDPLGRKCVLDLIKNLSKQQNITVVMVTHFMDEACLADRILVMNNGEIVMDNHPVKIFENSEKLLKIGLELPEIARLCKTLQENDFDIKIRTQIKEVAQDLKKIINKYK